MFRLLGAICKVRRKDGKGYGKEILGEMLKSVARENI